MVAQLIVERTDHTKEHMGLIIWADAPEERSKKSDVNFATGHVCLHL